jgi:C1A family cysteine protease
MSNEGLGRVYLPQEQEDNQRFPMAAQVPARSPRTFRYWNSNRWWGDQGGTSQCVAYTMAHAVERPDNRTTPWRSSGGHQRNRLGQWVFQGQQPLIDLDAGYKWMQQNDYWPGEDYDGTSVRAGADYLRKHGLIKSYHWGYDVDTIARAVLESGPVAVGTMWTMDMFVVSSKGFITPTGSDAGGHAYLLDGVNIRHRFFRLKNSWGRNWGQQGHARISFADMQSLLDEHGEGCILVR